MPRTTTVAQRASTPDSVLETVKKSAETAGGALGTRVPVDDGYTTNSTVSYTVLRNNVENKRRRGRIGTF